MGVGGRARAPSGLSAAAHRSAACCPRSLQLSAGVCGSCPLSAAHRTTHAPTIPFLCQTFVEGKPSVLAADPSVLVPDGSLHPHSRSRRTPVPVRRRREPPPVLWFARCTSCRGSARQPSCGRLPPKSAEASSGSATSHRTPLNQSLRGEAAAGFV